MKKRPFLVSIRHRYDWVEEIEVEATCEADAYNIADDESDENAHGGNIMCFDSELVEIAEMD
tara:strand:+ start:434 stop:619 length:186 start_codon:yes stop_codon:yes gene_type:complete